MSLSYPARIWGRNSIISTSVPKRDQTEPNSSPMAPAPTTAIFLGISVKAIAWSLVTIFSPSMGRLGISLGLDPVAIMIFFELIISASFLLESLRIDNSVADLKEAVP